MCASCRPSLMRPDLSDDIAACLVYVCAGRPACCQVLGVEIGKAAYTSAIAACRTSTSGTPFCTHSPIHPPTYPPPTHVPPSFWPFLLIEGTLRLLLVDYACGPGVGKERTPVWLRAVPHHGLLALCVCRG